MKKNLKKFLSALLGISLVIVSVAIPVSAVEKTYKDFVDDNVLNGDFEVGIANMAPYGWKIKSIESNTYFSTTTDFTQNFTLTTAVDNESKVANLSKTGIGYAVMGSQPVAVRGGADYTVSFDYRIAALNFTPAENCSNSLCQEDGECAFVNHWMGIITKIREYDKDGNLLYTDGNLYDVNTDSHASIGSGENRRAVTPEEFSRGIYTASREDGLGQAVMTDYETVAYDVALTANTAYVEIYVGYGTFNDVAHPQIYFDNFDFCIDPADNLVINDDLLNGDFEDITYEADGGRAAGIAGPLNWKNYSVTNYAAEEFHTTATYHNNYKFTIATETVDEATGKVNHFAEYRLIDSLMRQKGVKGYCIAASDRVEIPVAAGEKMTVKYKFKSYAADDNYDFVSSNYDPTKFDDDSTNDIGGFPPNFKVHFYTADGNIIKTKQNGQYVGIFTSSFEAQNAVTDWTEYSLSVTVPAEIYNAAYFTVSIFQGGNMTEDDINAVYCFDDIVVEYTVADESADSGFIETSVDSLGNAMDNNPYNGEYSLQFVNDEKRGEVIRLSGTNRNGSHFSTGYVAYMSENTIDLSKDKMITASFDYKVTGYALAERYHYILGGTVSGDIFNNAMAPQILFHYYDEDGNYIGKGAVRGETKRDIDWTRKVGTVVAPSNAAYAKWGMAIYSARKQASVMIKHYYDNIAVKNSTDTYWTTDYIAIDETNLFKYVLQAEGNANGDSAIDIADLVRINFKLNDKTGTVEIDSTADMNKNSKVDKEDMTILRWKLLGIDSEEKLDGLFAKTPAYSLRNKTAIFFGDSITAADRSWAYQIHRKYGAATVNAGKSGYALSTVRGENSRIITQVEIYKDYDFEYVVLHGGVNDAWSGAPVGTVSDSYDLESFDLGTYAGALEEMFCKAHTYFPNSKIGYIINYAAPIADQNLRDMSPYFTVAKQICEKWNIPYMDLYWGTTPDTDKSYSYDLLEMDKGTYGVTGSFDVHINEAGYEKISPYIANWVAGLNDNTDPRG